MKLLVIIGLLHLTFGNPISRQKYPWVYSGYFEGDIILTGNERNGVLDEKKRWPGGFIPIVIDEEFNNEEMFNIYGAIHEISNKTCIKFHARGEEQAFVHVRKGKPGSGCSSVVGYIGFEQTVNLEEGCAYSISTPIHELVHAIGFHHEQSRSDRDDYVEVIEANIQEGRKGNFHKYTEDQVTAFGVEYDFTSIMHYPKDAFSINGEDTIRSRIEGVEINPSDNLTEKDIQKIKLMYKDICEEE